MQVPKINELLSSKGLTATPEFFPTPSCTFYEVRSAYAHGAAGMVAHVQAEQDMHGY